MKITAVLILAILMSSACTKTEVFLPCPYSGQAVMGEIFYEQGGYETKRGYQYKYVIFAPRGVELVTVGLKKGVSNDGFDSLLIRAGAVDAVAIPLSSDVTIILMKSDGFDTKEMVELYSWSGNSEDLWSVVRPMWKQNPATVAEVKSYLEQHGSGRFRKEK